MSTEDSQEEVARSPGAVEVASEAAVSVFTVARAFGGSPAVTEKTRVRVFEAAVRLGYRRSEAELALRATSAGCVGVIRSKALFHGEIYQDMLVGMEETLSGQNIDVVLPGAPDEANLGLWLQRFVATRHCRALAAILETWTPATTEIFSSLGIPVVRLYHMPSEDPPDLNCVAFDTYGGIAQTVRYLADIGHRDIAFFNIMEVFAEQSRRERGFRDAMAECGLDVMESWVVPYKESAGAPAGATAFNDVFARTGRKPTAIVCAGDIVALGALSAAERWGKEIPRDISITGFDDYFWLRYFTPSVTTVRQSGVEMGSAAARLLLDALANPGQAPRSMVLPTGLVVRESTGPPGR